MKILMTTANFPTQHVMRFYQWLRFTKKFITTQNFKTSCFLFIIDLCRPFHSDFYFVRFNHWNKERYQSKTIQLYSISYLLLSEVKFDCSLNPVVIRQTDLTPIRLICELLDCLVVHSLHTPYSPLP